MCGKQYFLYVLFYLVNFCTAEDDVSSPSNITELVPVVTEPVGQIVAHDVAPQSPRASMVKKSALEPSLGLHGITEQQLNMRYYNFICSSHFHLDCKISETLQICMKDSYVAVLGLPLSFDNGSEDANFLAKWIQQCDQNDQDMNQEAMRIIRKRIHYQNENNWGNVFKASRGGLYSLFGGVAVLAVVKMFVL
uniref:Uncharacterized protein n=1 Tax=Caenorhabditis japonica TaxID=281687 RepID=A0A8R1DT17_CAEJA